MQIKHVPIVNTHYWLALIIASIFGANTGDYLSDTLGLGHINGLPLLLVLFVFVLIAERFDKIQHVAYYWAAIIIARISATNIGDIFHDFHISFLISIPCVAAALLLVVLLWRFKIVDYVSNQLQTNGFYWVSMLLAGTLGTLVGDYFSFPLGFGNLYATLFLGAVLVMIFFIGRKINLDWLAYFWLVVVLIRSAGTSAGDYFAHHLFGLPVSTLITGILFIGFLVFGHKIFSNK